MVSKAPEVPLLLACLPMQGSSLATMVREQWNVQPQLRTAKPVSQLAWFDGGLCFVGSTWEGLGLVTIVPPKLASGSLCAVAVT